MIDKVAFIGTVASKLQEMVTHAPGQPMREDLEKNIKAVLTGAFNKMELLTREEFAGQAAVLQRTREMVEALEVRVSELERKNGELPTETPIEVKSENSQEES